MEDVFKLDSRILDMKFYDEQGQVINDVILTIQLEDASFGRNKPIKSKSGSDLQAVAYPVPFDSDIVFEFELPDDESVNLSLFDATGKLVSELNMTLPAGHHQVTLPKAKNCPAGLYWYSLKAGQYYASDKITKN